MVFRYWHLAVLALLGAVVVWSFRVSPRRASLGLAATLVAVSGFLLYTLVLEEWYGDTDPNARVEDMGLIGIPALLGIGLGVLAFRGAKAR